MAVPAKQVLLGRRNQITLPKEFIPENIKIFECERREDGTIVLTPHIAIPASQAYFWTSRWQKGEREASRDIEENRLTRFRGAREMFKAISKRRKKK